MSGTQTTTELQSEDVRLVAAVVQSDDCAAQAAFGKLFVTHQPAFVRFCASLVGPTDGEDLAQNVWNRIWVTLRKKAGEDYGRHFRSVLFQSARRAAIDQWRSPASKVSGSEAPEEFIDPAPETGEVRLMQREAEQDRRQRLTHCMGKLKEGFEKRHAVAILRVQGQPVPKICQELGLERSRVDRLWHDAKKWLQECVNRGTA